MLCEDLQASGRSLFSEQTCLLHAGLSLTTGLWLWLPLHGCLGLKESKNLCSLREEIKAIPQGKDPTASVILGVFRLQLEVPQTVKRCNGHLKISSPATTSLSSYNSTDFLGLFVHWFVCGEPSSLTFSPTGCKIPPLPCAQANEIMAPPGHGVSCKGGHLT